jgi:outer membrane protein assembly factor BamB
MPDRITTALRALLFLIPLAITLPASADDAPQWGQAWSRNMVSAERGLPDSFDADKKTNVKWIAELGSESYSSPVVARGRVLVGTNNERPRDPRQEGDRAVLLCLDEKDGRLLWQLVVPKLSADEKDDYLDWPKAGFCSEPSVEGDRAYTLTNRGELVCLDLAGMDNGNDGPYQDEARHMAPRGHAPVEPSPTAADILWLCDLVKEAGIRTHDQVHGSILIDGDLLYVNSNNGVDNTHRVIRKPDAPGVVVVNKQTGRLVARDGRRIGPNTFHVAWCSPSLGEVNGRRLLFFGGPDGICYAFEAFKSPPPPADGTLATLKDAWQFDTDPKAPKTDVHKWVTNRREGPSVIMGMPVFHDGRLYITSGGDLWWGKRDGRLQCIDATGAAATGAAAGGASGSGDVTKSAEIWSYPLSRETSATPAVHDGLVFVTDCGGVIHCVDAATGKPVWTHKAAGDFWASPLVADGKIYAGTRRGQFVILSATREKKLLATIDLHDPISATVTAANGVLYVGTARNLYAVQRRP